MNYLMVMLMSPYWRWTGKVDLSFEIPKVELQDRMTGWFFWTTMYPEDGA